MLPGQVFDWESLSLISRCLLAALPMAGLLAVLPRTSTALLMVLPSMAVYATACWMLRCFDPKRLALARQLIGQPRPAEDSLTGPSPNTAC
jgi:hypothetical protein